MNESMRILAVDDSVTIRRALELILVPAGFQVDFAVNGGEAIEKAKQTRPGIVLLDFILPDMRGTEVCRQLLADPETRSIPVVLISARGAEIRQAYHDIDNVIDYLTKPFTPDAVLRVLREVFSGEHARVVDVASAPAPVTPAMAPTAQASEPPAIAAPTPEPSEAVAEVPDALEEEVDADDAPSAAELTERTRDGLEVMFETLRAGLEGVYVEESETPVGTGTDSARSYTELASHLAQQLGETLEQAESRQRFRLYGDGSVRSLDESLLDTYRRVCRLLFRAAAAGAVGETLGRTQPRVLVVCPRDTASHDALAELARDDAVAAQIFFVASDFRQLPMLMRLYGPTLMIVDAGRGGAVWEQLKVVRAMPEARRMRIAAVVSATADATRYSELGAETTLEPGPGLTEALRGWLTGVPLAAQHSNGEMPAELAASV